MTDPIKPGTLVWVPQGSFGWSAGIALTTTKKGVNIRYIDPKRRLTNGCRAAQDLVFRDPGQNGQDKPRPLAESAATSKETS